jgi:hypothetical protein
MEEMMTKNYEKIAKRYFELCSKQQNRVDDVFMGITAILLDEKMVETQGYMDWAWRNKDLVDADGNPNDKNREVLEFVKSRVWE